MFYIYYAKGLFGIRPISIYFVDERHDSFPMHLYSLEPLLAANDTPYVSTSHHALCNLQYRVLLCLGMSTSSEVLYRCTGMSNLNSSHEGTTRALRMVRFRLQDDAIANALFGMSKAEVEELYLTTKLHLPPQHVPGMR